MGCRDERVLELLEQIVTALEGSSDGTTDEAAVQSYRTSEERLNQMSYRLDQMSARRDRERRLRELDKKSG